MAWACPSRFSFVGCDRLIATGSRSGDLDLQKGRSSPTVARVPVPRDLSITGARGLSPAHFFSFWSVGRGPVPRNRCLARDRPSPYGKRGRSGYRSAGACPPRSFQAPSRVGPRRFPSAHPSGFPAIGAWRGTGPRPTVKRAVLSAARGRLRSGDRKLQTENGEGQALALR